MEIPVNVATSNQFLSKIPKTMYSTAAADLDSTDSGGVKTNNSSLDGFGLFHLLWVPRFPEAYFHPQPLFEINVRGTKECSNRSNDRQG